MADLSSAQTAFNPVTYAQSGRQAVIIKSTEGTSYHFLEGDFWEQSAAAAGLVVGRYHWAGESQSGVLHPPAVEAKFCLDHLGPHRPGRFVACDFENPLHGPPLYGLTPQSAAEWMAAFLGFLAVNGGWPGIGYSFLGDSVLSYLVKLFPRWYAAYPGPVPSDAALHQFSSHTLVPGVGYCDDSHCYIDLRQFSGLDAPTPPPSWKVIPTSGGPLVYQ